MKRNRAAVAVLLTLAVLLAALPALAESADLPSADSGLKRAPASDTGYLSAQGLAERCAAEITDGVPLFAPEHPQPLNACIATHEDCDVGIHLDGMYKVRDKGLVDSITKHLRAWEEAIAAASGQAIRFVEDPNDADVLICARQTYAYYADYASGDYTCSAYACTVTLEAVQLTHPENRFSISASNRPGDTITTTGGSTFWMFPPELAGTQELDSLVNAVLGWYGCDARNGSSGAGVKAAQQALIDRGFLEGAADGSFGPKTEAAVRRLQQAYGLEETGAIDRKTTVALYYDRAAVEAVD